MFETEKTHAIQKHEVVSIGNYIVGAYATSEYRFKTGSNCVNWFVSEMEDLAHIASTVLSHSEPMNLSAEDEVLFYGLKSVTYVKNRSPMRMIKFEITVILQVNSVVPHAIVAT